MELNWSTFLLEVVNFLILVWLLKRFLYRPVLDVIHRRRAEIEQRLARAEKLQSEARKLQERYEHRLADWEQERHRAREALARELESERARRMQEIEEELQEEREKMRAAEARRQADVKRRIEEEALAQAARFATRLLENLAGPELQERLVELAIGELSRLPRDRVKLLHDTGRGSADSIEVSTAFVLSDEQKGKLKEALHALAGMVIPVHFRLDSSLIAGVRVTIGDWSLGLNLRDELRGFAELSRGG